MPAKNIPNSLRNEYDEQIDISGDEKILEGVKNKQSRKKRRIITTEQYGMETRWPNSTIPYEFDYDTSDLLRAKFQAAINLWQDHSCIRFEPFSRARHSHHKSMILIKNNGQCAARVGYIIDPSVELTVLDVFLPDHCPVISFHYCFFIECSIC